MTYPLKLHQTRLLTGVNFDMVAYRINFKLFCQDNCHNDLPLVLGMIQVKR